MEEQPDLVQGHIENEEPITNWDSKGKVYYTNKYGYKLNLNINPLEKALYDLEATRINLADMLASTDPESQDYKDKEKIMFTMLGLIPTAKYIPQLYNASRLLIHKPFENMTKEEYNAFGKIGKQYYKKYIQKNVVENENIGTVDFRGKQAGKPDYKYMEQYPFLRRNIKNAKDIVSKGLNKERNDATYFDDLKIKWNGNDYLYQIRHNPYLENPDFYNIKPYDK